MSYTIKTAGTYPINNNSTTFAAWGSLISNALANCGWTQATGVGTQINWSTVPVPNTAVQFPGYEIWQMNDSLQNTAPIYVKFEYGGYSANPTIPRIRLTLGAGANSSGNITGNTSSALDIQDYTFSTSLWPSWFSGANNRFCAAMWAGGAAVSLMFTIERTVDANGTPTGTGAFVASWVYSAGNKQVAWTPTTGNTTAIETSFGLLMPDVSGVVSGYTQGAGRIGTQLAYYPLFFSYGPFFPPGTTLMGYFSGEFTTGVPYTLPVGNTTMTYIALGNSYCANVSIRSGGKSAFLMRWE
jgi:hypothetical protein